MHHAKKMRVAALSFYVIINTRSNRDWLLSCSALLLMLRSEIIIIAYTGYLVIVAYMINGMMLLINN